MHKSIMIQKSVLVAFFGSRLVEEAIAFKGHSLSHGANLFHVKGGLWTVVGHHYGEAEKTINTIKKNAESTVDSYSFNRAK